MSANQRLLQLEQELARRQGGEAQPVIPPTQNNRLMELEQELARREAQEIAGGSLQPKPWQQFIKGALVTGPTELAATAASAPALISDLAAKLAGSIGGKTPEEIESIKKILEPYMPHLTEGASKGASEAFHNVTGFPQPEAGTEPSTAEEIGKFMSPIPGEKLKLAGQGVKALPEMAGKLFRRAGEATGAVTAMNELPNISEEGGLLENLGKGIIGGAFGRGAAGVALHPKQTAKSLGARAASLGAEPNVEALNLAKKHGVELPLSVGMGSTPLNWVSNALSNTVFASKKFKKSFQESNKSMLDAVNKNIDTLGKDVEPSVASQEFKDFLIQEEKGVKKLVDSEYDKARSFLKEGDSVVPAHTANTIHEMKEILTRDIKSPETQAVSKYVLTLAKNWDLMPKDIKLGKDWEKLAEDPKSMAKIMDAMSKNIKSLPVQKLEGVRSEIGKILGHPQEVYGMEKWLSGLQSSISKDLETSTNKAYTQEIKKANNFFRENYANRFREDLADSIMTGKEPLYTFNKLTDTHTLNTVEKIAGESPKAKEMVDALKKARVRQIFNNALTDEGIKVGNFTRVFDKSEVDQEFFKKLLGSDAYKNLDDISKIMHEQMASGREILNTSKTAYVASDIAKIEKFGYGVAGALITLFSMNPALGLKGLGGAAAGIAIPNLTSRLIADKDFIKQARAFAIARKNGNMKYSDQLLDSLGKRASHILKTAAYAENKQEKEKE